MGRKENSFKSGQVVKVQEGGGSEVKGLRPGLRLHGGLCAGPWHDPPTRCLSAQLYNHPEPEELRSDPSVLGAVGFIHPRLRVEAWSHVIVTQPENIGLCVAEASVVSLVGFGTDKPRGSRWPDAERPPGREAGLEAALRMGQNKEAEAVSGRAWADGAVVLTGWVGSLWPVTRPVA